LRNYLLYINVIKIINFIYSKDLYKKSIFYFYIYLALIYGYFFLVDLRIIEINYYRFLQSFCLNRIYISCLDSNLEYYENYQIKIWYNFYLFYKIMQKK